MEVYHGSLFLARAIIDRFDLFGKLDIEPNNLSRVPRGDGIIADGSWHNGAMSNDGSLADVQCSGQDTGVLTNKCIGTDFGWVEDRKKAGSSELAPSAWQMLMFQEACSVGYPSIIANPETCPYFYGARVAEEDVRADFQGRGSIAVGSDVKVSVL